MIEHSGQIGFPGGKYEEIDKNLEATALRESHEEIGIQEQDVQIVGRLSDLYIPVSDFLVHPFVGYLDYAPMFVLQENEVKDILEVDFELFFLPKILKKMDYRINEKMTLRDVPYFDINGHVVWGATAMILGELLAIARKIGF